MPTPPDRRELYVEILVSAVLPFFSFPPPRVGFVGLVAAPENQPSPSVFPPRALHALEAACSCGQRLEGLTPPICSKFLFPLVHHRVQSDNESRKVPNHCVDPPKLGISPE